MTDLLRVACIQLNSQADIAANLATIVPQLAEAQKNGATFIALPENATFIGGDDAPRRDSALPEESHPAIP
ncbi:MAG: carbon-nitrogen hydrolase family protein, partial [Alphaproteobacteria bacterium]|nr:carbon-nitrogen hydrolase family protein [Alphaproteobacteria bacterium]